MPLRNADRFGAPAALKKTVSFRIQIGPSQSRSSAGAENQGWKNSGDAVRHADGSAVDGRLCVDPALPDWLPDIRVNNLRVAAVRWDIRFWREGNATRFEVLDGDRNAVAHVPFVRSSDIRRRGDA